MSPRHVFVILVCFIVTACESSGSNPYPDWYRPDYPDECQLPPIEAIAEDAPTIVLNGAAVISVALGQTYNDAGATAVDAKDGDISGKIKVDGLEKLDTAVKGDYMLRYRVNDSDGHAAAEAIRLVRVHDGSFARYSLRPFAETSSGAGFFEHLPTFYGDDPQRKYPLIIVAHGWGHFVQHSPQQDRVSTLVQGTNIYKAFDKGAWPDSRPFVVLTPQRCANVGMMEWAKVDRFIDWAIKTYNIDPARIYMTGLSAGGYFTWRFPMEHPGRLAAIAPMSGGGPTAAHEVDKFCDSMKTLPVWSFHGVADGVVPASQSSKTVDFLRNYCPATPPPRLSLFENAGHDVANSVWDGSYMGKASPSGDPFDQSVFDWFLSHTLASQR